MKRSDILLWWALIFILSGHSVQLRAQISGNPEFSISGGIHNSPMEVILSAKNGASIYYTMDGTIPTQNAFLYTAPLFIDKTTAIRSIAIETGKTSSEIVTQTYFINEPVNLAMVSLVTDPANLFSNETGIYVTGTNGVRGACDPVIRNLNQDWERPVNIELYEKNGTLAFNQAAGIKIFGGCSRTRFPQKSFSIYARKEYGKGTFDYQLFPDKPMKEFESFLLRSSADDQVRTMFNDAFTAYVLKDNMDIDYMAYRPSAVFINGKYWGIHNLREKVNEHYLTGNFGLNEKDVNLLERNATTVFGSNSGYNQMISFISSNTLSNSANYEAVTKLVDINQFIDYEIANIHLAEVDWPGNNIKFWNAKNSMYDKWRWILFDRDQTFLSYRATTNALALATATNGPNWPNPPWSTLLLRKLLENQNFKNRFIQTYAYHISTTFESNRVSHILDQFKAGIAAEIPRHISRWGGQLDPDKSETWPAPTFSSVQQWETNVESVRSFLPNREAAALQHLKTFFGLGERSTIVLESSNGGEIKLFDKILPSIHTASYFNGVPMKLSAEAKYGFRFSHWKVDGQINSSQEIEITPSKQMTISAHFEESAASTLSLVINEINYHSADISNSGDWVELFNPNDYAVNISAWKLKDGSVDNVFAFRPNTIIQKNGYLVICESITDFDLIFPSVLNRIGGLGFKLSNGGDAIKLLTHEDIRIDSVMFDDKSPWPILADGQGSSLELIDFSLDNTLAESWRASVTSGSPGRNNNDLILSVSEQPVKLYEHFPNPVNGLATLSYSLSEAGVVVLKLFDMQGREVDTIVNEFQERNTYQKDYDFSRIKPGIYLVAISANGKFQTNKIVVMQ